MRDLIKRYTILKPSIQGKGKLTAGLIKKLQVYFTRAIRSNPTSTDDMQNNFMTAGDVFHAGKKRLTQFAAKYLEEVNFETVQPEHVCLGTDIVIEDAVTIQHCLAGVTKAII